MNRSLSRVHIGVRTFLIVALSACGFGPTAQAQGFRGVPPSPEESFRRMDRNQNGQIDPDEVPSFFKDMYARAGMDVSRPISQQEFLAGSQRLREQFEQGRASGQFQCPSRRSEGGPSGDMRPPGEPDRRDTPRAEESFGPDFRRDDRDDRRRREDRETANDSRGKESSTGKTVKKEKKPKPRVTKDLPDEYRDRDKNGDGQIGLYEWDRKAFAQFYELDRNGDGLLTPDELLPPKSKSDKDKNGKKDGSGSKVAVDSKPAASKTDAAPSSDSGQSAATTKLSANQAASTETSAGARAFQFLDTNKDGQVTQDEWNRSRTAR
ncbi:MAG TPA: hypothetical protein VK137_13530, partial [Planctomycetaceae bacterium]|nr:hypothetical protein [Planctomycetaceae bacterium]